MKGGDLRTWQNVNALSTVGDVAVFGLCSNDRRAAEVPPRAAEIWCSSSDPALAYPPPRDRELVSRAWFLDPSAHPSDIYYSERACAEIEDLVARYRPDLVVIERLWLQKYINGLERFGCRIVLDNHNVETVLQQQLAASTNGGRHRPRAVSDSLVARTHALERQAAYNVDQIWVCSSDDAETMHALFAPPAPVCVVPNTIDVDRYRPPERLQRPAELDSTKPVLIYPAMFGYAPNAAAAEFLLDTLVPELRADGYDHRLALVGGMPTPAMCAAAGVDRDIVVTGTVADVRPYLWASSVMVVPLLEGSGTRFKILEAFAAGIPVLSTARGAEGLSVQHGKHLLIAEGGEMARAIESLATDRELADRLSRNGLDLVRNLYSWDVAGRAVVNAVKTLERQPERQRTKHALCRSNKP
jgi:glycosyltransferase involved in cell wall biosynthesis